MTRIVGAVLLAGGRGRRFGSDKRQARLGSGETLLATTVRRYAEVFTHLRVVLRAEDTALAQALAPSLDRPAAPAPAISAAQAAAPAGTAAARATTDRQVVFSSRADGGMGFTLADGIASIAGWDVAFVGLGDMPWVTHTTLCALVARARDAGARWDILQPLHFGVPGHPVGFRASLFPALRALAGDEGARHVVRAHRDRTLQLPVLDAGVLQDVDTPEALAGR